MNKKTIEKYISYLYNLDTVSCVKVIKKYGLKLEILLELSNKKNQDPDILEAICCLSQTPTPILDTLSGHEVDYVRAKAIVNKNVSLSSIINLLFDSEDLPRKTAIKRFLCLIRDNNTKYLIYSYLNDNIEIFNKLLYHDDEDIKLEMLNSPLANITHFINLSNDNSDVVRAVVAAKEQPQEILVKLSDDKNWLVRLAVAKNKLTPPITVIKLANDTNIAVRDTAMLRITVN